MAALEFTRRYAMAHRLLATESPKCGIPHGHNEFVTIKLTPIDKFKFNATNSTAPFEQVKRRWHGWIDEHVDHACDRHSRSVPGFPRPCRSRPVQFRLLALQQMKRRGAC